MRDPDPDLDSDDTIDDVNDADETIDIEPEATPDIEVVPDDDGGVEIVPDDGDAHDDSPEGAHGSPKKSGGGSKRRAMKAARSARRGRKAAPAVTESAMFPDSLSDVDDPSSTDSIVPEAKAIRYVRLDSLVLEYKHWSNPRILTGLGEADISALSESIRSMTMATIDGEGTIAGIGRPLEVVRIINNGDVVNLVIDGQRRYRGMEVLGLPPDTLVPVEDLEPAPIEWTRPVADAYLKRVLSLEGTKRGLGSFELVESALRLREARNPDTKKDHTLAEIAVILGRSESWVSKMLTARSMAKPALVLAWKMGKVTDEQFKDLAAVNGGKQKEATEAVLEAAASGGKQEARTLAKELVALAKAERAAAKAQTEADRAADKAEDQPDRPAKAGKQKKGDKPPKVKAAVRGPQGEIKVPPPKKPPPKAVIEELLAQAVSHPPTHDYVKGIMAGVLYATGGVDPIDFGRPWHTWISMLERRASKKE